MQAIIDFFVGITNVITSLIEFVVSIIIDIVYVVQLTGSFLLKIPYIFSFMPSEVISLFIAFFGVVVIYKVVGREG